MKTSAHKERIGILRGGVGSYRPRSMSSGQEISQILKDDKNTDPIDIVVVNADEWLMHGYGKRPAEILAHLDGVISTIRGEYGEGGGLFRDLQRYSIPYFGSDPFSTNITHNKFQTKNILQSEGMSMAKHMRVTKDSENDVPRIAEAISKLFEGKYIVKPTNGDSGDDIRIVENTTDLAKVLREMIAKYDDVIVEKFINGKAVTCGVISDFRFQDVYTTPSIELVLGDDKSFAHHTNEKIVPARLSKSEKQLVAELAQKAHKSLNLNAFSSSDFIVTSSGDVVYLETNAIPSIDANSTFRAGLAAVGVGFEEMTHHQRNNLTF